MLDEKRRSIVRNNKTMNIVYLIEDFSIKGGAERIISQKAEILSSDYGHDVTIVSIFRDERPPAYPLCKVKFVSLEVPFAVKECGIIRKTLSRTRVLVQAATRFNKAMKNIQPDIIFFTLSLGALLLPLYRGKAKRIYESHSTKKFTPYSSFFTPMERAADAVVCLTDDDAHEYRHAKNIQVIPNFIDPIQKNTVNYAIKRAIAVGRLEYVKGFDRLIRCWKAAVGKHPGWQLDIYGEGPLREKLQEQINSLGLENSVTLRGTCGNMTERYADYSLHLMTSHYEGFPMTLLEAQAAGLPSVTFDFEYGARSIVIDGITGIIVPQDDEQAFTAAMQTIMDSKELRKQYGTEAMKAAGKFSRAEVMERWNSLINSFQ